MRAPEGVGLRSASRDAHAHFCDGDRSTRGRAHAFSCANDDGCVAAHVGSAPAAYSRTAGRGADTRSRRIRGVAHAASASGSRVAGAATSPPAASLRLRVQFVGVRGDAGLLMGDDCHLIGDDARIEGGYCDIVPGDSSIFVGEAPDAGSGWNLRAAPGRELRPFLEKFGAKMPGVNWGMLYFGAPRAFFVGHGEDASLSSINYLRCAAPMNRYAPSIGRAPSSASRAITSRRAGASAANPCGTRRRSRRRRSSRTRLCRWPTKTMRSSASKAPAT